MTVYATHVMLSTGGHQEQPDLGTKAFNNKIIMSDHFLAGIIIIINNSSNNNNNNIIIIIITTTIITRRYNRGTG